MTMRSRSIWLCIAFLLCTDYFAKADIFTAVSSFEKLINAKQHVAEGIKAYIQQEEERLDRLRKIAEGYETNNQDAQYDEEAGLGNPVYAYVLVKRFTLDWDKMSDIMYRNSSDATFLQNIKNNMADFPTIDDFTGTAKALLRIQDTYALNASQIADGELEKGKESPKLTAEDCFEIGRTAYFKGDFYHAILWMEEALGRLDSETPESVDRAILLDYFAFSFYKQGDIQRALNLTVEWLKIDPENRRAQSNKKDYEKEMIDTSGKKSSTPKKSERIRDGFHTTQEFLDYEALCRGEKIHNNYKWHKYSCQYKRHHPYFYIRPLKEETILHDPFVAVYHDVVTETENLAIKQLAKPKLFRSGVFTLKKDDTQYSEQRVSKSAWLNDWEHEKVAHLSKKVYFFSNMTIETAEPFQVLNYGIGGHYEPHYDFNQPNEFAHDDDFLAHGNRIMTVICYLTDVEAGGATVFSGLGLKVQPSRGACALWYNLKANGQLDYRTRHAGCPVLAGSKWITNKWLHEGGQEFTRPCTLNPDE